MIEEKMLKKLTKSYINSTKLEKMYDIELEEKENSLEFILKKSEDAKDIPLLKKYLLLKNRDSGKKIAKEFKESVTLTGKDLEKLGDDGVIDAYLRFHLLKKDFLIRSRFLNQHKGKCLLDYTNKTIFETYPTINKKLSFNLRKGLFKAYLNSVEKKEDCLRFHGKIKLLEDMEFDKVEVLSQSNKGQVKIFPCEFELEESNSYLFDFDLKIDSIDEDELNGSWSLDLCLKNNYETLDKDMLLSSELSDYSNEESYYLETLELKDIIRNSDDSNNIKPFLLLYSTKGLALRYHLLEEDSCNKIIQKAKNLDKYEYFKENLEIDENLIFFESFHGKYNNNPKYIYEKMMEMGYDKKYKFVWSLENDDGNPDDELSEDLIPRNPIIVSSDEEDYYKYLAISKYRVNNATFLKTIDNRKETVYLQTWHGTPLKRLGKDINVENPGVSWNHFNKEVKTWDYLISANEFSTKTFKRAFSYKNQVLELGYPANDIFYQDNEEKINNLKERYNIPKDKKIILYAPTFRDDKLDDDGNRIFELELDLERLYDEFNEDYFLIIKTHYVVSKNLNIDSKMSDFAIDLSDHDDIHELYIISDILITDYSSTFFDYAHSKRPILFFMTDLEEYINSRGVYEELLNNLPGPKLTDNEELIDCLKNIDAMKEEYSSDYEEFYNAFCNIGHGDASESIIKEVFGDLN